MTKRKDKSNMRAARPRSSLTAFLLGWGLIIAGIILWFASYAVTSHTEKELDLAKSRLELAKRNILAACTSTSDTYWSARERQQAAWSSAIRLDDKAGMVELQSKIDELEWQRDEKLNKYFAELEVLTNEADKEEERIKRIGENVTLAVRIGGGIFSLLGVILVTYWLGSGGMRSKKDYQL